MASQSRTLAIMGLILVAWVATRLSASRVESIPPASSAPTQAALPAPPKISTAAMEANFEECREKLKAAAKLNLLTDMSFDNGRPKVVVGRTWYNIDFSAKEGLARTAACFFLAGDSTKAIRYEITDNMTGKVVASWSGTRLRVD